jgi:hypothetical protein
MSLSRDEARVILISAGTASRRRALSNEGSALMESIDWPRLTRSLRARKLLPLLGPRILELANHRAPHEFVIAVRHALAEGRRQAALLQLVSQRAIGVLAEAGVRSTPIKGPYLGEAIYGDPGRRLSSDIDLLVAPDELRLAVELLLTLGYRPPTDQVDDRDLPLLHFALVHDAEQLPPIELHWRIHWYERLFAGERLLAPATGHVGDWHPAAGDELAALLLLYARDGFVDLRLATDVSAWWDVFGDRLPPAALEFVIEDYPRLGPALRAAGEVCERVLGLPSTRFLRKTRLGLRQKLAVRLAEPNPRGSRAQLYADAGFVDGLLMPRDDFIAFLRRQVFLPKQVLLDYAGTSPDWRAKSKADYAVRVVFRYGIAVLRSIRGRTA